MINDNQLEVPCIGSIKSGDSVMIVTRNGEPTAIAAAGWGDSMSESVEAAAQTATEAAAVAAATNQHFTFDANGAHVSTAVTTDQQGNTVADLTTGSVQTLGSQGNLQMLDGKLLRSDTASGTSFYDGAVPPTDQNLASHIVASFNAGGAQIGKTGESHMELDYHSLRMVDKDGDAYFEVADLRGSGGKAELTEDFDAGGMTYNLTYLATRIVSCTVDGAPVGYTTSTVLGVTQVLLSTAPSSGSTVTVVYETESQDAKSYTIGTRDANASAGAMSYAEGREVEASGYVSHAEGDRTRATGRVSHAEGVLTLASGDWSHAEGSWAYATGSNSHAEGQSTRASRQAAHAEGYGTRASGSMSHAEGSLTKAAGNYSHAQNIATIAEGYAQTAIGKYNLVDLNDEYALIIGNGGEYIGDDFIDPAHPDYDYESEYTHSNALTVDWDGNVECGSVNGSGTVVPATTASIDVPVSTNTDICSVSLTPGIWIVTGMIFFESNATGRRSIRLSTTSQDSSNLPGMFLQTAVSGAATRMSTTRCFVLTSQSTVYLVGSHNAGAKLTCQGKLEATKIG